MHFTKYIFTWLIYSHIFNRIHVACMVIGYGDLQISGGGGSSGLLEFRLYNDTWGYVCSTGFYSSAATVACRQLGYTSGYYSTNYNYYG